MLIVKTVWVRQLVIASVTPQRRKELAGGGRTGEAATELRVMFASDVADP